jgi:predicted nucleic acid-binding protein
MKYLLDSNVISELRKNPARINPSVLAWSKEVDFADCYLSSITLFEAEVGVLLREQKDPLQAALLRAWLENDILVEFKWRILPVSTDVALKAARFHVPDPSPKMDALIGATALVNGCVVVTRNARDFERFGIEILNPWEFAV